MLKKLTFLKNYRGFTKGDTYDFCPGLNFLVGDQGAGKSTLLRTIQAYRRNKPDLIEVDADRSKTISFDFEKDNPRVQNGIAERVGSMIAQINSRFKSHGEANNSILDNLVNAHDMLLMFDEPDAALSMRSADRLGQLMIQAANNGCQIIAAIHNPIVLMYVNEVLSLEHKSWVSRESFMKNHLPRWKVVPRCEENLLMPNTDLEESPSSDSEPITSPLMPT